MAVPKQGSFLKKVFLFFLILSSFSFAITLNSVVKASPAQHLMLGTSRPIVSFYVEGASTLQSLRIKNSSSAVPFSSEGINRVEIYVAGGAFINAVDLTSAVPVDEVTITGLNTVISSGKTLEIYYKVDEKADYTESGGANVETSCQITGAEDSSWHYNNEATITKKVVPSGLVYYSEGFDNLISDNDINVGPGNKDVPMFAFTLRAENMDVTLNWVEFYNNGGNYGISLADALSGIQKVYLYQDDGNKVFDGIQAETLIVATALPTEPTQSTVVRLTIPSGVKLNQYDNIPANEVKFYVVYDIGNGIDVGETIECKLYNAGGTITGPSTVELAGTLPAGASSTTIKQTNVTLLEATTAASANGDIVVAGQRKIKMFSFKLEIDKELDGVSIEIYNAAGTFKPDDDGVRRVSLYQDSSPAILLASKTVDGSNQNTVTLANIRLNQSASTEYYVEYDIGINAAFGPSDAYSMAQLKSITGTDVVFGGYTPAPVMVPTVKLYRYRVNVEWLTCNATEVSSGGSFQVDMDLRNIWILWSPPHDDQATTVDLKNVLCQPVFYEGSIDGRDISAEYTVVADPWNPTKVTPNPSASFEMSYTVTPGDLRTVGTVIVDAMIGYLDKNGNTILYHRHKENGVMKSAAREFTVDGTGENRYDSFTVSSITDVAYDTRIPSYIDYMWTEDSLGTETVKFMSGDTLPNGYNLVIQLVASGNYLEKGSIVIKKNGIVMSAGSNSYVFDDANGTITVYDLGSSGLISIEAMSGDKQLSTAMIGYSVASGEQVTNVRAGPSPYDPSTGPMIIGYQATAVHTFSVHIYDAAGRLVFEEKDKPGKIGFNFVSWDGGLLSSGTAGRGAYIAKIVVKFGDAKKVYTTKFGVL